MKITKRQLKRIIREQAAVAQIPKDVQNRIKKITDPEDLEALENAVEEVWAGEKDISELEDMLADIEGGRGAEKEMMEITKRQLRRIIKEEKAKLLKEQPEGAQTYRITMLVAVAPGSEGYILSSIEDGMEFDEDAGEGILEYDIEVEG